jgi:hypothetical protein
MTGLYHYEHHYYPAQRSLAGPVSMPGICRLYSLKSHNFSSAFAHPGHIDLHDVLIPVTNSTQ